MERKFTFKKLNGTNSNSTCGSLFQKANNSPLKSPQPTIQTKIDNFKLKRIQDESTSMDCLPFNTTPKKKLQTTASPKNKKTKEFNSQMNLRAFMQNKTENKTFKNPFLNTAAAQSNKTGLPNEDDEDDDWINIRSQKSVKTKIESPKKFNFKPQIKENINSELVETYANPPVKPLVKEKVESELISNLEKDEKVIEHQVKKSNSNSINSNNLEKLFIQDTPTKAIVKKDKIKKIDDTEICPSCKSEYGRGPKRRLVDECSHGACFSCITQGIPCTICNSEELNKDQEDKTLNETGLTLEQLGELLDSSTDKSLNSPVLVKNNSKQIENNEALEIRPLRITNTAKSFEFREKSSKIDCYEVVDLEKEHFIQNINGTNMSTQKPIQLDDDQVKNKKINYFDEEDPDEDEDLILIEDVDFNDPKEANQANLQNNKLTKGVYIPDIEKYEKINWLFNDIKDCSFQFRSLEYEHTEELLNKFRNSFGLKQFRPQQFEAVNAALLGNNTFILMPTGGGKSLCYQLPAIINKGVTFVISPLKSLIIDQVQKLNALGINACHMLSDPSNESSEFDSNVYSALNKQEPIYKLIYITPEKLNNSGKLRNTITNLYNRGMIARLVIDEAHCVSQWGHDFRTDYKKMGELRNSLIPNVPVMLLTATATPRVRNDILVQMRLSISDTPASPAFNQNNNRLENKLNNRHYMTAPSHYNQASQKCVFFMQSFNRENLQYQVEYKTSNQAVMDKIITIIKERFSNKSGIVYCISRNECESVSDFLRKNGIKALAYHAGMEDTKRQTVQHKWTNNIDCKVVCATIAFGMGIDKPDVRYVIHLGLPKSLEGYYQESGRAGRDGLVSVCILFYNNQDRHKWLRLLQHEQKGNPNANSVAYKTHVENIYRMAQYCDNRTDCRRAQILEYFGEKFDRRKCIESKMNTICDNCQLQESNQFSLVDITQDAISICKGVQQLSSRDDVTLLHLSEILKGSMNSKITEKNHQELEMHSKLSKYRKNDIERILRKLIFMGYLKEDVKVLQHSETVASYIKIGPKASQLIYNNSGMNKIEFELIEDGSKIGKAKKCKVLKSDEENEDSEEETGKKKVKLSDSSAINRILLRCQNDIKRLIKTIGSEKSVKNTASLFTTKMLGEMIQKLPETKEALLGVTGYTESIFNNYKGDEFLKIFQHYSKLRKDIQEEELKKLEQKQIEKAKARAVQSVACFKNNKTYGLLDTDEMPSIDFNSTNQKWLNSKSTAASSHATSSNGNKRKFNNYNNNNSSYSSKKAKTSNYNNNNNEYSNGDGESSTKYFKKKSYFAKKSKFKKWPKNPRIILF